MHKGFCLPSSIIDTVLSESKVRTSDNSGLLSITDKAMAAVSRVDRDPSVGWVRITYLLLVSQTIFTYVYNKHRDLSKGSNSCFNKQCRPRSDCSKRSSLIRVYTVCHSICTLCTIFSVEKPLYLNFREIIYVAKFSGG